MSILAKSLQGFYCNQQFDTVIRIQDTDKPKKFTFSDVEFDDCLAIELDYTKTSTADSINILFGASYSISPLIIHTENKEGKIMNDVTLPYLYFDTRSLKDYFIMILHYFNYPKTIYFNVRTFQKQRIN